MRTATFILAAILSLLCETHDLFYEMISVSEKRTENCRYSEMWKVNNVEGGRFL